MLAVAYNLGMRTPLSCWLLGAALGAGPLVLAWGCQSSNATQVTGDGGAGGGVDGSAGSSDLAGSDLAGSDLAGSDLAGSSAPADMATSGKTEEDPKLQGITALHNQQRASVNPQPAIALPPLTWDANIAQAAQTWANGCVFAHSSNGYGENIYASAVSSTPAAVVGNWVSEKSFYNYNTNTCSSTCGHYTQVVWRASMRLGCAQKTCTTGSPFGSGSWQFWVCDYDPPGNRGGQRPY